MTRREFIRALKQRGHDYDGDGPDWPITETARPRHSDGPRIVDWTGRGDDLRVYVDVRDRATALRCLDALRKETT